MKQYLKCIRSAKGVNSEECRRLSQGYLQCRMDRNLMAVDSMRNLGFSDLDGDGAKDRKAVGGAGDGERRREG